MSRCVPRRLARLMVGPVREATAGLLAATVALAGGYASLRRSRS